MSETNVQNTSEHNRGQLVDFLSKFLRTSDIAPDTDLFAEGHVNSMFALQLVQFVERLFGIKVADEDLDIENFRTIEAILALVDRSGAQVPR
jgi:acyl carrier protein